LGKKTSGYILAGKYSGKKPFRRNGDIWEDNIKVYITNNNGVRVFTYSTLHNKLNLNLNIFRRVWKLGRWRFLTMSSGTRKENSSAIRVYRIEVQPPSPNALSPLFASRKLMFFLRLLTSNVLMTDAIVPSLFYHPIRSS
jgi:hypothetical protein